MGFVEVIPPPRMRVVLTGSEQDLLVRLSDGEHGGQHPRVRPAARTK